MLVVFKLTVVKTEKTANMAALPPTQKEQTYFPADWILF